MSNSPRRKAIKRERYTRRLVAQAKASDVWLRNVAAAAEAFALSSQRSEAALRDLTEAFRTRWTS
jgi:hypothetical protein